MGFNEADPKSSSIMICLTEIQDICTPTQRLDAEIVLKGDETKKYKSLAEEVEVEGNIDCFKLQILMEMPQYVKREKV